MTDEDRFRREARQAMCEALAIPPRLLTPLPRSLRRRLWLRRRVDDAACWLACRDHGTAARRLWKLFRMWD